MSKFKKLISIIGKGIVNLFILLLVILVIIAIITFVQINILNYRYINFAGYTLFTTETGSMSPTIEIGDIVIVKINDEFEENDIISYKDEDNIITHRVKKIEDNKIITQGDNNNSEDDKIDKDKVIGRVVYTIHNVEIWKNVFSDISVIIPLTITVILLILIIAYKEKNNTLEYGEK
jgi:signal peptidase